MSTVQTFIKKERLNDFKRYMERRKLTPYKAAAELIELGLEYVKTGGRLERGSEKAAATDTGATERVIEKRERTEPPFVRRRVLY